MCVCVKESEIPMSVFLHLAGDFNVWEGIGDVDRGGGGNITVCLFLKTMLALALAASVSHSQDGGRFLKLTVCFERPALTDTTTFSF